MGIDVREYGGGFVSRAPGHRGLHAAFPCFAPAEIADVPRAVGQGGGVDAGDILHVEKLHRAARFRVAADAVSVEEKTFVGIGDGVQDLLGLIGGERRSGEDRGSGYAAALRDGQTGGRDSGIFARNGIEIVGVRFRDYARADAVRV